MQNNKKHAMSQIPFLPKDVKTMSAPATTVSTRDEAAQPPRTRTSRPHATLLFHWILALLVAWIVAGAMSDAWAHNNIASLETFFTPWHAILYSSIAVTMP